MGAVTKVFASMIHGFDHSASVSFVGLSISPVYLLIAGPVVIVFD